ncbi:MAG: hypothetical protein L3K26_07225, partial [Candidatus Hydrogenedentes bacterium]|nr:hypothetical protein [Candidatus Hydrogenedentota bacterium]
MKYRIILALLSLCLNASGALQGVAQPDTADLFRALLDAPKASSLNKAFAGMVLNRDIPEANARLEAAWEAAMGDHETLTPEVADEQFKWQMRTWVRIYYLFGPWGDFGPGRLSKENTARIEDLFWNYASVKSTLARADVKYVWFIQGSENHDMMDLGNAFLAVKALALNPDYQA